MDYPLALYFVAPLLVVLAYVVFGVTGFGSNIIIVPVLAHFLPITFIVPLCLLLDIGATLLLRGHTRGVRDTAELRWLLPGALIGMVSGGLVLALAPARWLMFVLGVFVAGYAVLSLTVLRSRRGTIGRLWGLPISLVGGVAASLFGAGGAVLSIYVSRRVHDAGRLRATMATLVEISAWARVVIFTVAGLLLKLALGLFAVALCPFMWVGLRLGARLHDHLNADQVRRVVNLLLIVSGLSLMARALTLPA